MADIVDIANDNQQEIKHVSKYDFAQPSKTHCIDCDDEIPQARQKLGGVTRCVKCQEWHDNRR